MLENLVEELLVTHRKILAEAGNPPPVAGSTNRRPFDPREEPRALAGMRGSVRGIPSNGNLYRDRCAQGPLFASSKPCLRVHEYQL